MTRLPPCDHDECPPTRCMHPNGEPPLSPAPGSALCCECGGNHEPSGARSDCIGHWKRLALNAETQLGIAESLLINATPNPKFLTMGYQRKWAEQFGKWWAERMHGCHTPNEQAHVRREPERTQL